MLLRNCLADSLARAAATAPRGTDLDVTVVATTKTSIPSGTGPFEFFTFPTIGGIGTGFQGSGASQVTGIYQWIDGSLTRLVAVGAAFPSLGAFTNLGLPVAGDDAFVFYGEGLVGGPGIYTAKTGEMAVVANGLTQVPSSLGTFKSFDSTPSYDRGFAAFIGTDETGARGVYSGVPGQQSVRQIARQGGSMPSGSGSFHLLSNPDVSGDTVAFYGADTSQKPMVRGIYAGASSTNLVTVFDSTTQAPDGTGTFSGFTAPAISSSGVAVTALTANSSGVYASKHGVAWTVANLETAIPGGSGTFASFANSTPSIDGETVVFYGVAANGTAGLYASNGSSLVKIFDENDTIGGQAIQWTGFNFHQVSDGTVAFYALLANGVFGIFTLAIPAS